MQSTPLVRHILRDEAVTRGLGDVEARMLVEWLADRAERTAAAVPTDAAGWAAVRALCRRARGVACFVRLWADPDARGAAGQLAAAEAMPWPLPARDADPGEVMAAILAWTDRRDAIAGRPPARRAA